MSAVLDKNTNRNYELVLILKETRGTATNAETLSEILTVLQKRNVTSIQPEEWGTRKLYHLKKKEAKGVFHYIKFEANPKDIPIISQDLKINLNTLNVVITRI